LSPLLVDRQKGARDAIEAIEAIEAQGFAFGSLFARADSGSDE